MGMTLHICTTCRRQVAPKEAVEEAAPANAVAQAQAEAGAETGAEDIRPGAALHQALLAEDLPEGVTLVPVECLSACSQGCSVAFSAPGRWSYVYGRMGPEDAAEILRGAAAYATTEDGLVPWRERPQILRKRSLARVPPQPSLPPQPLAPASSSLCKEN